MFPSDSSGDFDFMDFYKHFWFLLKALKYSEGVVGDAPTFLRLAQNL